MSDNKYVKLGFSIFVAIVAAGIILTLVQRWMYASAMEEAQKNYQEYYQKATGKAMQNSIDAQQEFGSKAVKYNQHSAELMALQKQKVIAQLNAQTEQQRAESARWKIENERRIREQKRKNENYARMQAKKKADREKRREEEKAKRAREIRLATSQSKAESINRQSKRSTNNDTCNYWRSEYRKSKTDYNYNYMQSACKRAATD